MRRRYWKKGLALALALFVGIGMLPVQDVKAAGAAEETADGEEPELEYERIDIRTAEEFAAVAEKCSIDAWSMNKYICLKADIRLAGAKVPSVPVFNGIFDGEGHTISGFDCTGDGYVMGLFRYIESRGVVRNLTLKGSIDSENEKECIGSICGINYGIIENCTFQGTVGGRDTVGGIAGINESTGRITGCTAKGRITGYYSTGGIAGINHGMLGSCTNHAGINDDNAWVEEDDEMGTSAEIIQRLTSSDGHELHSGIDTGGIAGFSDGVISRCANSGIVGYEHTGYNIGGIAGRQSGIVSLCVNHGTVYGRKDVGGIVGQMEPFIEVNEAESLRDAVNKLHDLINKTLDDMGAGKNAVRADFDNMARCGDAVLEAGDALAGQLSGFVDDNVDQAQEITVRMEYVMDMLPDVFDNVSDAGDSLSRMNHVLKRVNDDLDIAGRLDDSPYDETDSRRVALLSTIGGNLVCDRISPGAGETVTVTALPDTDYALGGIRVEDADGRDVPCSKVKDNKYTFAMTEANVKVYADFRYEGAAADVSLSSNYSGNASWKKQNGTVTLNIRPDTGFTLKNAPAATNAENMACISRQGGYDVYEFKIADSTEPCSVTIEFQRQSRSKSEAVDAAKADIRADIEALQEASDRVNQTISNISDKKAPTNEELTELAENLGDMSSAAASILSNLGTISKIMGPYMSDAAKDLKKDLDEAVDYVQRAVNSLKTASSSMRVIVNYINAQDNIRFTKLGSDFDMTREDLHDQLQGISDSIKSLNRNASDYSDIVNADLRAVNDQMNVVLNLLADRMADSGQPDMEKLYEDVDDENLDAVTTGRADACRNKGVVKGDINVGGIAGSMDIDNEDPEGSAAGTVEYRLGRRFITKCVITNSVNEGYVTAKKDGAGGICGYMNHGVIMDSEGYGSVESTEGGFAGGICGESYTVIKRCYALCLVSGNKNVGGIAGYAESLKNCYAMVNVEAENGRAGAIAGQISSYEAVDADASGKKPKVAENYYVSGAGDVLYGIDSVSYTGVAEPVSYDDLLTVENLPAPFWHLKVIYRIEDLYLGSEEIEYGTALDSLHYPRIPEKEGFYGEWPDVADKVMNGTVVIEAAYRDNVTVVPSGTDGRTGEGAWSKPYALAEDVFTADTVLNVAVSGRTPPAEAAGKQYVLYDVSIENGNVGMTDSFALRVLNPYGDAAVYGYRDGSWILLESRSRGQYLQVDMTGAQGYFCVVENKSGRIVLIGAAAAAVVLMLLAAAIKKMRSRGKKKAVKNTDTEE